MVNYELIKNFRFKATTKQNWTLTLFKEEMPKWNRNLIALFVRVWKWELKIQFAAFMIKALEEMVILEN